MTEFRDDTPTGGPGLPHETGEAVSITTGTVLEDMVILDRMGRGGMGDIFKAFDRKLYRPAAIKVIRAGLLDHDHRDEFIERFRREARVIARFSHENIVQVYRLRDDAQPMYMVLEWIEGQTLAEMLEQRGSITWEEVLPLLLETLEGLGYAHSKGIVHRDIKPSNIMVEARRGIVKITDFGLARVTGVEPEGGGERLILGTPHYMAPEQIQGEEAGPRADIYALGITVFQLLTGQLPFADTPEKSVLAQHLNLPLPEPASLKAIEGGRVLKVLRKMTAKKPRDRYSSCEELQQELRKRFGVRERTGAVLYAPRPSDLAAAAVPEKRVAAGPYESLPCRLARVFGSPDSARIISFLGLDDPDPIALDGLIVEQALCGFHGISPDQVSFEADPEPPGFPPYVLETRQLIPPPEPNRPKLFLTRWDAPVADEAAQLRLFGFVSDHLTRMAMAQCSDKIRTGMESGALSLAKLPRPLVCHNTVITADRKLALYRRSSRLADCPNTWSASFEQQLSPQGSLVRCASLDLDAAIRDGLHGELGIPEEEAAAADIRIVAIGFEPQFWAAAMIAVVQLPSVQSTQLTDFIRGAHDHEHTCAWTVDLSPGECIKLLKSGRVEPQHAQEAAGPLHEASRLKILATLFHVFGYERVLPMIGE